MTNEPCKCGRKGVTVTFIPTFVYHSDDEVLKSMQAEDENDWIQPMQLTRYSGVKINISGSGTGTAANIEASKFDGVFYRSVAALEKFYSGKDEDDSSSTSYSNLLETTIKFVPGNSALKGKTASYIASQVDYNTAMSIANSLDCSSNNKFAAANQKQKDAIILAAVLNYVKTLVQPDILGEYQSNPASVASKVSPETFQWISYLDANWPGVIAECGIQNQANSVSDSAVVIYDCPMKTPDNTKKDAQGLVKVYACRITIDTKRNNPVHIEIKEGKGRPQANHSVGIDAGSYVKGVEKQFDFTADEWLNALNVCKEIRSSALNAEYPRLMNLVRHQRETSIARTKGKKQAQTQSQFQNQQQIQAQQQVQFQQYQQYQQMQNTQTQMYAYPVQPQQYAG